MCVILSFDIQKASKKSLGFMIDDLKLTFKTLANRFMHRVIEKLI